MNRLTKNERLQAIADMVRTWPEYMRCESSASKQAKRCTCIPPFYADDCKRLGRCIFSVPRGRA